MEQKPELATYRSIRLKPSKSSVSQERLDGHDRRKCPFTILRTD